MSRSSKGSWTRFPAVALLGLSGLLSIPASAATLSGSLWVKGSKEPALGAALYFQGTGGNSRLFSASPDGRGGYSIEIPDGTYRITVAGPGFRERILPEVGLRGERRMDHYLERSGFTLSEVIVTARATGGAEGSRESVTKRELASVPGTGGDVLRALQTLPGVAVIGDLSGQLLVRGGGPQDNIYLLDRIPIAFPFHFGGLLSTLNSDLIETVDFSAGGFGAEYGNYWGGVVDVKQRDPRRDRWGARAEVNLLLSQGLVEGPVAPNASLAVAGRRSYLELLGGLFDDFTAIPSFGDYQAKLSWDPSRNEHWDLQAFGSDDRLGLTIEPDSELASQDPAFAGTFEYHNAYHSQGMNYRLRDGEGNTWWATAYHYNFFFGTRLGTELFLDVGYEDFGGRADWIRDFDPDARLKVGLEYHHALIRTDAYFVSPPGEGNPDFDLTTAERISSKIETVSNNAALYAEQVFRWFGGAAEFKVGGRWDLQTYNSKTDWSPRFSAAVFLSDRTTLRGSFGLYHQLAISGPYLNPDFGNPDLESSRSATAILGLEQILPDSLSLKVEAYHKDLSRVVVSDPGTRYSNKGSGTSRGLELFLRRAPTERLFGWISYAWSESLRYDGPDRAPRIYDYDQPHIVTVVAGYKLNLGWDVGLKWRYGSGLPETPVVGSYYEAEYDRYRPLYGPVNSARLPDYHRLDLSTSLTTTYDTWEWRIFLEILNLYDQPNVFAYSYNRDYSQRRELRQLPLLPYLGVEVKY